MIPAPFEYHAPGSLSDALALLEQHGEEARVLAGGHSLLPMMKLRLAVPAHVIDLGRIPGLRYVREEGQEIAVGAMTTHHMLETDDVLRRRAPLLGETAAHVGDLQVRNLGTIGGSLAHADPAADYPAAVLALESTLVAESPRGRRAIPAGEFFTGLYTTALAPGEIVVEVRLPAQPPRAGAAYLKFPHPASGFAVVGVAVLLTLADASRCERARVGVTGVASVPYRARAVEEALTGRTPDDAVVASAAGHAADGVDVNTDLFASAEYRGHLASVLTKRAVRAALERARAAS